MSNLSNEQKMKAKLVHVVLDNEFDQKFKEQKEEAATSNNAEKCMKFITDSLVYWIERAPLQTKGQRLSEHESIIAAKCAVEIYTIKKNLSSLSWDILLAKMRKQLSRNILTRLDQSEDKAFALFAELSRLDAIVYFNNDDN